MTDPRILAACVATECPLAPRCERHEAQMPEDLAGWVKRIIPPDVGPNCAQFAPAAWGNGSENGEMD